jgi:hypothetical protein
MAIYTLPQPCPPARTNTLGEWLTFFSLVLTGMQILGIRR